VSLVATQVMNLAFIWPLQHVGLALAIGLGACLNAALLCRTLRRRGIYAPQPGWGLFLMKVLIALCAMAAVLWLTSGQPEEWLEAGAAARAGRLTLIIALGAATYLGALFACGFRPRDFAKRT
jgi:putative peptidoglycan lipid II flippase